MASVLLLDSTYEPLRIISWEDAMQMVVTGDGEIIEVHEDKVIRSATQEWKMPSVVRQFKKFKRVGEVNFNRINVFMRDSFTCQYCTVKKKACHLTFDHVLPRDQGGKTTWENIVAACKPCNSFKDNRTPEQAKMKLLKKPERPKWLPYQMSVRMKKVPDKWMPYIDVRSLNYWTVELEE
jgi:5-methylcytosine-specific restriction endonuclease McrA